MNIQRILCPVDFSEANQAAQEYASVLAESSNAKIIYLHAFLPAPIYGMPEMFDAEVETQQLLDQMKSEYSTPADNNTEYVVKIGSPADQIVSFANENDIDLIVLGTHGRTGLSRMVMGSVAEAVVRRADCPVLAIKAGAKTLNAG